MSQSKKNSLKNYAEFVESLLLKRELRICKGREGKGKKVAEKCLLRDHENQPEIPVNFAGGEKPAENFHANLERGRRKRTGKVSE